MTAAKKKCRRSAKTKKCWSGYVPDATSANSMKRKSAKDKEQMYVVRKYVMAHSAADAIANEHKVLPRDVWLDDEWRKERQATLVDAIGFDLEHYDSTEYEDKKRNRKRI